MSAVDEDEHVHHDAACHPNTKKNSRIAGFLLTAFGNFNGVNADPGFKAVQYLLINIHSAHLQVLDLTFK